MRMKTGICFTGPGVLQQPAVEFMGSAMFHCSLYYSVPQRDTLLKDFIDAN